MHCGPDAMPASPRPESAAARHCAIDALRVRLTCTGVCCRASEPLACCEFEPSGLQHSHECAGGACHLEELIRTNFCHAAFESREKEVHSKHLDVANKRVELRAEVTDLLDLSGSGGAQPSSQLAAAVSEDEVRRELRLLHVRLRRDEAVEGKQLAEWKLACGEEYWLLRALRERVASFAHGLHLTAGGEAVLPSLEPCLGRWQDVRRVQEARRAALCETLDLVLLDLEAARRACKRLHAPRQPQAEAAPHVQVQPQALPQPQQLPQLPPAEQPPPPPPQPHQPQGGPKIFRSSVFLPTMREADTAHDWAERLLGRSGEVRQADLNRPNYSVDPRLAPRTAQAAAFDALVQQTIHAERRAPGAAVHEPGGDVGKLLQAARRAAAAQQLAPPERAEDGRSPAPAHRPAQQPCRPHSAPPSGKLHSPLSTGAAHTDEPDAHEEAGGAQPRTAAPAAPAALEPPPKRAKHAALTQAGRQAAMDRECGSGRFLVHVVPTGLEGRMQPLFECLGCHDVAINRKHALLHRARCADQVDGWALPERCVRLKDVPRVHRADDGIFFARLRIASNRYAFLGKCAAEAEAQLRYDLAGIALCPATTGGREFFDREGALRLASRCAWFLPEFQRAVHRGASLRAPIEKLLAEVRRNPAEAVMHG